MSGLYKLQINPKTGRPFKLGDLVSKGQLIIHLEDKEYENGIAIDAKELSLEIAEQEQSKQKALYEKGGVTLSEMRNTEVKVTNARYDLENARINLEKMNIKAPFDGVIVDLCRPGRVNQFTDRTFFQFRYRNRCGYIAGRILRLIVTTGCYYGK